jgi:hypothetical protein
MPRVLEKLEMERFKDGTVWIRAKVLPTDYTEGHHLLTFIMRPIKGEGHELTEATVRQYPLPKVLITKACWVCALDEVMHSIAILLDTDADDVAVLGRDMPKPTLEFGLEDPDIEGSDVPVRVIPLDSELGQQIARQLGIVPDAPKTTKH